MPITNPFGDDSDESSDGFTNPFSKKASKNKKNAKGTSKASSAPLQKRVTPPSNNPFDDSKSAVQPPSKSRKDHVAPKKVNTNPFAADNDGADAGVGFGKKKVATTSTNPFEPPSLISPSDKDSKSRNEKFGFNASAGAGKNTNPFSPDSDNNDFAPLSSAAPPPTTTKSGKAAVKPKAISPPSVPAPLVTNVVQSARKVKSKPIAMKTNERSKTVGVMSLDPFESKGRVGGTVGRRPSSSGDAAGGTKKSNNPFDFDPDFEDGDIGATGDRGKKDKTINGGGGRGKKTLWGGRRKVEDSKARPDELSPIMSNMDQDVDQQQQHRRVVSIAGEGRAKKKASKPGFLHNRSKSDATALKGGGTTTFNSAPNEASLAGWLRGNKTADDSDAGGPNTPKRGKNRKKGKVGISPAGPSSQRKSSSKKKKKKKNVFVQCWPYDDYHKDQQKYYESIQDKEGGMSSPKTRRKDNDEYNSGSDEDFKEGRGNEATSDFDNEDMFDRPVDLPSIKEAVQNLSLLDFENKAEQRAISIVSTWLYDAGLIDELLVNGANGGYRFPMAGGHSVVGQSTSIGSVKSSEGIEIGAHGFPIEGGLKIDKEIDKLRASTQRELTLINTRLNDGVAASGAEVNELVNAVSATKSELGRLRELATYISSGYRKDGSLATKGVKEGILLADYPRLKRAINARRNIFRCFRELEFFSQIPLTCDRLREELHHGEWTANEWNTIRNVCMEHVELEILLVEAEAGMKAWLDDDEPGDDDSSVPSLRSNKSLKKSWRGRQQTAMIAGNHQVVDDFLSQHVKNVWELGDEIRMRILSGVGSAFDLALQNPAGMVALVEAVEVYERAAEQYNASRGDVDDVGDNKNKLRFTNMRAAALAQLYQDFELRGLEVFRAIHMQAADAAEEEDALNSQFTAVLRAATELVTEIDVVKNQMAPCFAPHWHVEVLWSSCVAHVCSNQIIQQIGGPDGQNLPDLSVTQLLDLVAWVEFFRETIEDAFPSVGTMHAKKTYFDERPDLFAGDDKEVNMENATDSLAWVNNMLWEVHRLAQDEFLLRTREQTDEWISKVYNTSHETTQTREGRLVTSLCEDVFSLTGVQLRTIRERLSRKSDALVMAVCLIFSQLRAKQLVSRDKFLKDLETCCASANDFQRMSEQVEDVVQDLIDHSELPDGSVKMLEDSCGALVSLYSGDAVFAAQKAHSYIFEPIWDAISGDLFGRKWEVELTHNELAMTLTRTLVSATKNSNPLSMNVSHAMN